MLHWWEHFLWTTETIPAQISCGLGTQLPAGPRGSMFSKMVKRSNIQIVNSIILTWYIFINSNFTFVSYLILSRTFYIIHRPAHISWDLGPRLQKGKAPGWGSEGEAPRNLFLKSWKFGIIQNVKNIISTHYSSPVTWRHTYDSDLTFNKYFILHILYHKQPDYISWSLERSP